MAVYKDSLWCKGTCNEFAWQIIGTELMVSWELVQACMPAYRDRVYVARVIATGLYDSLQGQGFWCQGNCNEFYGSLQAQS